MRARAKDDEGFGIAEALIAILLFGILSVALVPPIILALQVSARSTTIATAASVTNERVELARQSNASCADYLAFLRQPIPGYDDARGVEFTVTQTPSAADANAYVVSPKGGPNDADADGVLDSFCTDGTFHVMHFAVSVVSTAPRNPDSAGASTLIAVPGLAE